MEGKTPALPFFCHDGGPAFRSAGQADKTGLQGAPMNQASLRPHALKLELVEKLHQRTATISGLSEDAGVPLRPQ